MQNLLKEHHCEAVVVHCIDFRFHDAIAKFLHDELKSYDIIAIAGAGKHLTHAGSPERQKGLLEDIGISLRLHDPKQIIIINHADCGAYGGRVAFASADAEHDAHAAAIREATDTLKKNFSDREIKTFFANILNEDIVIEKA